MLLLLVALAASPVPVASPVPADSRQLVLSVSPGWDATTARVRLYSRTSAATPWLPAGEAVDASLGRSGLAWGRGLHPSGLLGPKKSEGDGRSPAGVFALRLATGYASEPPPGTRLSYRQATETLRCVDDSRSAFYNRLVDEREVRKDWTSAEDMRRPDDLYRLLVWVGHNDAPAAPEGGSCIFLHVRASAASVTAGCTALDEAPMEGILRWLDPAAAPVLVQLPEAAWRGLAKRWELPALDPATGASAAAR
jgi:L,D-peptidoglycan transpeptidase YkuD (ErfK/YbiS/YcfS/YnhG family)